MTIYVLLSRRRVANVEFSSYSEDKIKEFKKIKNKN